MTAVDARTNIGRLTDLPIGEGRAFAVGGEQVAVFRLRDGRVYALGAVCPHKGGPIADGQIDGRVVICPLHMNIFELATGACLSGTAPLPAWQVEVDEQGDVLVGPRLG